jgi:hypothetical protein
MLTKLGITQGERAGAAYNKMGWESSRVKDAGKAQSPNLGRR